MAIATSPNPTVVAGSHYIYSRKDDANDVQECFMRDSANNAPIQFTQGGSIGSDATTYRFESLSHDSGTTTYDEDNFATAWGTFNSAGALQYGKGIASGANPLAGRYTITFENALLDTNYMVMAIPQAAAYQGGLTSQSYALTETTFMVGFRDASNTGTPTAFSVLVFGGR